MNGGLQTLWLFFLLAAGQLSAQPLITAHTDSVIRAGIELSIRQDYDAALALFGRLEAEQPASPVGPFFHAAVLQSRMMDYERYDAEPAFLALVRRTVERADAYVKKVGPDPWAYFFLGGGYGYLAFYQAKQSRLYEAFRYGQRSVAALKRAVALDSTLYDAYLGLGTYQYFRSKLSRHLAWLPFVNDDRREGLARIRLAMERGRYARFSAVNSYFWIALEEGEFEEAARLAQLGLSAFPESRVFLWCAAKLAARRERWEEAVHYFGRILSSLAAEGVLSPYNELVCRRFLTEGYWRLGQMDRAAAQCARLAEIQLDDATRRRHPQGWKEARQICAGLASEGAAGSQ